MKKFELFVEGYNEDNSYADPVFLGEFEAETFKEAVSKFKDSCTDQHSKRCVDVEKMTFWAKKIYPSIEELNLDIPDRVFTIPCHKIILP